MFLGIECLHMECKAWMSRRCGKYLSKSWRSLVVDEA